MCVSLISFGLPFTNACLPFVCDVLASVDSSSLCHALCAVRFLSIRLFVCLSNTYVLPYVNDLAFFHLSHYM